MAMEDVLKCLIRDSQALGRGYLHIKESSQVALGDFHILQPFQLKLFVYFL